MEQRIFGVNRQRPDLLVITPERSVLVELQWSIRLHPLAQQLDTMWPPGPWRATRELSTITWQDFRVHRYWPLLLRPSVASASKQWRLSICSRPPPSHPLHPISIHRCPQRRPRCWQLPCSEATPSSPVLAPCARGRRLLRAIGSKAYRTLCGSHTHRRWIHCPD